jgi:shikimate kinase
MNLIFLYGPPATGKLTVANELVKLTGYKLFHNHLTQDLVNDIYPEFNSLRFELVHRLRLDTFEYAAKNNTDLIFTFVYADMDDDKNFVKKTVETVEKSGGQVLFVQLTAPVEELMSRVGHESRQKFQKIKNPDKLREVLGRVDLNTKVDYENVLKIDTSKNSPIESANLIVNYFGLVNQ